ncbi:16S rRNA (cytidine(1402)-2'-O)-methyltransferase, partial [bacterium]|nr:16S rRNA (cytidine(1402)-2'-O)-methyltransferase [bacterium]
MPTLFIVATPIGNLEDVTFRALRVFKEADVILCEDTRVTGKLLKHYGIATPTLSYHARSGKAKYDKIFDLLHAGKNLALVSDAGTPAISDPGSFLISAVKEEFGDEIKIAPIPGASAVTAALSAGGVPAPSFLFLGFLPHKKGRETLFKEIAESERTVVFYESPHRIMKALESLRQHAPERKITLARELTKIYEEFLFGTAEELLALLLKDKEKIRGEFVVIVDVAGKLKGQ